MKIQTVKQGKNNKRLGKKADISFNTVNFVVRLIFLLIVSFFIFFLIRSQLITQVDVQDAQIEVFANRLLYSAGGLSYYDFELKRVYPGIMQPEIFEQAFFTANIEPVIFYGIQNRLIGAKLTLLEVDSSSINGKEHVVFYNKDFYEEKEVLYQANKAFKKGKGGIYGKELTYPVIIREIGKERQGTLKMIVLLQST